MTDWPQPTPPPFPADDEGCAPERRCVWLDDDLCGLIYTALAHSYPSDIAKADTFWKAWKAAPANPVEALITALRDLGLDGRSQPDDAVAERLARALGWEAPA